MATIVLGGWVKTPMLNEGSGADDPPFRHAPTLFFWRLPLTGGRPRCFTVSSALTRLNDKIRRTLRAFLV